jgi:hypothetical protein
MRKVIALVLASLLVLATAGGTLAARPEIFRDASSGSEYDQYYSDRCGFDVWLTYRTTFSVIQNTDGSYTSTFDTVRVSSGPGGSVKRIIHLVFTSDEGFQLIGDPDGDHQERLQELAHGSRVWSAPGMGVVYSDAGYYDATLVITVTGDDVTEELTDVVFHGKPGSFDEEDLDALLCATIG